MDSQEREMLIRIDERVATIISDIAEIKGESLRTSDAVAGRFNNHAGRIRKLELWRSWLAGGIAALGTGVLGVLAKVLT